MGAFVPSVTSQREKHGCGKGKRVKDGLFTLKLEDTNPLLLLRRRKKKTTSKVNCCNVFSPSIFFSFAAKDKKILCKQQERRGGELS